MHDVRSLNRHDKRILNCFCFIDDAVMHDAASCIIDTFSEVRRTLNPERLNLIG